MSKRISLPVVAAIAVLLSLPASAQACSCAAPGPGEKREHYRDALKRSDAAISGKVVRRIEVPDEAEEPGGPVGPGQAILVYRIKRSFKNERLERGSRVRVHTSGDGASCGLEQRVGTTGGLFLQRDRNRGRWSGYLCDQVDPRTLRRVAKRGTQGRTAGAAGGGCPGGA